MNEFEPAIPILNVKNVEASIDYYVKVLGFESDWEWDTPAKFASVSRDKATIFLAQGVQGHSGTWLYIFMKDVDALHKENTKQVMRSFARSRQTLTGVAAK